MCGERAWAASSPTEASCQAPARVERHLTGTDAEGQGGGKAGATGTGTHSQPQTPEVAPQRRPLNSLGGRSLDVWRGGASRTSPLPPCVPPPAQKGAVLAPRCRPKEGVPGPGETPALTASVSGTTAMRGRGSRAPGGHWGGCGRRYAYLHGVAGHVLAPPARGPRAELGTAGEARLRPTQRGGRGGGGHDGTPARRAALSGLLRSGPAWPGRRVRAPRPPAPAAAGPVT